MPHTAELAQLDAHYQSIPPVALMQLTIAGYDGHRLLFVATIASLGIALGALWEVAEWTADFFVEKQIVSGLFDTVTDLILDSAGALCAALLNLWGLNELSRAENAAKAQGRDRARNRLARQPETSGEAAG